MKNRKLISNCLIYIFLIAVLLITIMPLLYTVMGSFKTNVEILTKSNLLPEKFQFSNYVRAWNSESFNVPILLKNSIIYTVYEVFITLFLSSMAGYVFARGEFKGKKVIFACFTSLLFIKTGGIGIYATFKILHGIHMDQSLWSLMFIHLFNIPVINMFLVKGNIEAIPRAIDEAAEIDGASFVEIFFRIILPMLKPILATITILAFNASWNDYLMPTIFTTNIPSQRTLIVGLMSLKSSGEAAASVDLMLAGTTIALIPVLVAYAVCNKYFVKGIAAGAVKG